MMRWFGLMVVCGMVVVGCGGSGDLGGPVARKAAAHEAEGEAAGTVETEGVGDDEARIAAAKELFERCVELEAAFDPAGLDLYAEGAKIQNTRVYPTGERRVMTLTVPQLRELYMQVLSKAKELGDRSTYSSVTYTVEGENVRIEGDRYSVLKDYTSPFSTLVGPDKDGEWRILEDITESRP